MKKALALLLALVMCLSLVACGENTNNSTADVSEIVIGDWSGEYESQYKVKYGGKDVNIGDTMTLTVSIFKGGAMQIHRYDNDTGAEITWSGTWEETDGIIVLTHDNAISVVTISYELKLDAEPYTMSIQGTSMDFPNTLAKAK